MSYQEHLQSLYHSFFHEHCEAMEPMAAHGSDRKYIRMKSPHGSCLGAYNPNAKENRAFVEFSRHFRSKHINVPQVYAVNEEQNIYLVQDLGNTTLFQYMEQERQDGTLTDEVLRKYYRSVLRSLVQLQIHGGQGLNYDLCYPINYFGKQAMLWDLNYFKYCFLKVEGIPFDEAGLEKDFHTLVNFLTQTDTDHFLYRDFQSRNIMLYNDEVYFIDYQGGRRGALQYDVASLLFEPKARLPFELRNALLQDYLDFLSEEIPVDKTRFIDYYYGFVYMRALQALGAYGFRGTVERKPGFRQSIPLAQRNLKWLSEHVKLPIDTPELDVVLQRIISTKRWGGDEERTPQKLTINLMSFSYKKSVPQDPTEHGGGFIFDCRALPNPGRYAEYKTYTGKDKPVVEFFADKPEMEVFLNYVEALVSYSVKIYLKRDFKHLFVAFGCTGGQHRSVYCAEQLAKRLSQKFDIEIALIHREQDERNLKVK